MQLLNLLELRNFLNTLSDKQLAYPICVYQKEEDLFLHVTECQIGFADDYFSPVENDQPVFINTSNIGE